MKKLLLLAGLFCFTLFSVKAQTVLYSQNFNASMTSIPAGWKQQQATYTPTNLGWQFANAYSPGGGYLSYYWGTSGSYFAYVNDADNNSSNSNNKDTLYSTSFSTLGYAHVFISVDVMYYQASENATVAVSTNGGATWNTAGSFYGVGNWTTETINLSAYAANKANVMIAITYADNSNWTWGLAVDNISVFAPLNYDMGVTSQNQTYLVQVGKPYTLTGVVHNFGGDSIVSMNLKYSVNGGAPVNDALSALSIIGNADYNFSHATTWTPSVAGNYTVKFWTDSFNGANADANDLNDTLVTYFMAVDSIQTKKVLLEEFMQASCNPCMYAAPNLNAVARYAYATNTANFVRYHVNWPGTDYMNNVTQGPFVGSRVTYYGVSGVPDAKLDGTTDVSPSSVSTTDIQNARSIGSPLKITIDSTRFNPVTNKYTATATIKSYGNFSSGLKAMAVLTVDTITYAADQSTEDPINKNGAIHGFKPPLGNDAAGNEDSLFPYVMAFPNVVENMLPTSSGTTLGTFVPYGTQTITLSWTKNHAWGSSPKTYKYDSIGDHMTIFVQTNTAIAAAGVPAHYVFQSASVPITGTIGLGMKELSKGVYYEMYPNPAKNVTNIAFGLDKEQNVSIEVYNLLGEKVSTVNQGMVAAGNHIVPINTSSLQSGIYIVRFIADNAATTSKLVIER